MSDRQTLSPSLAMTAVFLGTIVPSLPPITEVTSSWRSFPGSGASKQELDYAHARKACQNKVRSWGLTVSRMVSKDAISVDAAAVTQVRSDRHTSSIE